MQHTCSGKLRACTASSNTMPGRQPESSTYQGHPQAACWPSTILQGYLFPAHHITYWTGLYTNTTASGGTWGWVYPAAAGRSNLLQPSSYSRWGVPQPEYLGLPPEPNNLQPPEQCAAANASEAYWPGDAWAWADAGCNTKMAAMCRIMPPGLFWWGLRCLPHGFLQLLWH